jgi:hypothetical protein
MSLLWFKTVEAYGRQIHDQFKSNGNTLICPFNIFAYEVTYIRLEFYKTIFENIVNKMV